MVPGATSRGWGHRPPSGSPSRLFKFSRTVNLLRRNFSGATVVRNCELDRCGGYDHDWSWRAALQVGLDRSNDRIMDAELAAGAITPAQAIRLSGGDLGFGRRRHEGLRSQRHRSGLHPGADE